MVHHCFNHVVYRLSTEMISLTHHHHQGFCLITFTSIFSNHHFLPPSFLKHSIVASIKISHHRLLSAAGSLSICNPTRAILSSQKILLNSNFVFQIQLGCPPLPPSPSQLCVSPAGAQDCHYHTDHCCCGHCQKFSCALDSTTGAGLWQMSTLCPAAGCGSEGEWR